MHTLRKCNQLLLSQSGKGYKMTSDDPNLPFDSNPLMLRNVSMRSPQDLKPKSFSLNLTPMIDVVFLLIIFFVVSNAVMRQEATMKLNLPNATTGKEIGRTNTGKIVVNVAGEGKLFLGTRPVSLDQLRVELARQQSESNVPLEIRIRTDRLVPYRFIEPILVVCAQTGLGNVSFSVLESK